MAMLLCSITGSAHDFEVDGIYYNITSSSEKTVQVTWQDQYYQTYNEYKGEVVIPSTVTYNSVSYSVTAIQYDAFRDCKTLTSVTIPETVTEIKSAAFRGTGLISIFIPKSVTSIEGYVFHDCGSLASIVVDDENAYYDSRDNCNAIINKSFNRLEYGCSNTIIPTSVECLSSSAFFGRTNLTSIVIPDNIAYLSGNTFEGCSNLVSVTLSSNLKNTGTREFYNCNSLKNITIPEGMTEIKAYTFYLCSSLTSIEIPNGITDIDDYAFSGCSSLKEVHINDLSAWFGIEFGYDYAGANPLCCGGNLYLNNVELADLAIPEDVSAIPANSFAGSGIASVTFHEGVKSVGYEAFKSCKSLTSVIALSPIAPTRGSNAFKSISSSAVLTIPSGSTSSYEDAGWTSYFSSVVEMEEDVLATSLALDVTEASLAPNETLTLTGTLLPEDVTNPALSWVSSDEAVATVDANGVVTAVAVGEATITASTTDGSELSASCKVSVKISGTCGENLTWVLDEATGVLTISGEGEMYDYNHLTENQSPWKNYSIKEVIVEEGVTSIGSGAFAALYYSECDVASVSLPEGLESIGGAAFSGCSLSEISFPSTLKSIGGEAFGYCASLEEIYIPASVESVAGNSFYGVTLTSIVVDGENTVYDSREECNGIIETATNKLILGCTNTTIPEGVEVIAEFAFTASWDPEKVLSIPSSVTSIEGLAFYHGMTSSLKEVVCYATTPPVLGKSAFCLSADNIPTLRVPALSVEAYKAADGWKEFLNIQALVPAAETITINQYGNGTFCSNESLDFSEVEGLKAYAATGYNTTTGVVTLTRVMTAKAGVGLFVKGEPGEYNVPVIESTADNTLNMLVGTLENIAVNSTSDDGIYANYKYTILEGDATPMFYRFADGSTLSAGKAYLQIPLAWMPAETKSISLRFDDGETTDMEEKESLEQSSDVIYDLMGRRVTMPQGGSLYLINGKIFIY